MQERPRGEASPWEEPPSEEIGVEPCRVLTFGPRWQGNRPRAFDPRRKLYARGAGALATAELLALVIGRRSRKEAPLGIAAGLVRRHGLAKLAGFRPDQWVAEPSIGRAAAARLSAVFELGRRAWDRDAGKERPKIARPSEAFEQVRDIGAARKEHLVGLYLDAQNGLLEREVLSIGSLNTTRTHPREILYPAIRHLALGFILAHNHPSGCLDPSEEDVEFTRSVKRAGEMMGIELYDHLIVASARYTSLRERGLL